MRVSVVGGSQAPPAVERDARAVGRLLGERGHTVVCGGLGGVMAAACRGASEAGGRAIGILPGEDRAAANPHVDAAIATGLGHARNALVVLNGDAVVALPGGPGTCSEVGLAGAYGRPVATLGEHDADHVERVDGPAAAVDWVEDAVES